MLRRFGSLLLVLAALAVPVVAGPAPGPSPVTAPYAAVDSEYAAGAHAVVSSPTGRVWVLRVTPGGVLKTRYTKDSAPYWTDWAPMAGSYRSVSGAIADVGGVRRLFMAAVTSGGGLRYATHTGTEWTGWTSVSSTQLWASVASTTDAAGRVWTFATTTGGDLYYQRQQADGSWTTFTQVARVGTTAWAAVSGALQTGANRVWLAAASADGRISTFRTNSAGTLVDPATRATFKCDGGPSTGFADDVSLSGDASGRMWLFSSRSATGALTYCQTGPGTTTWGPEKSWGTADWVGVSSGWDADDAQMWVAGTKETGEVMYRHTSPDPSGWTDVATVDRVALSYAVYLAPRGSVSADYGTYLAHEGAHEGIDVRRMVGSSVHALVSGTITNVDVGCRGAGPGCLSTVAVYNATLDKTVVYLHLNPASLSPGDTVARGQTIGYEDYRGTTQPQFHTHVEVRPGRHTIAATSMCSGGEPADAPCNVLANPDPTTFWTGQGYAPDQDRSLLGGHAVVSDRSGREWEFVIAPGGTLVYRYTGMTEWNWDVFGDGYDGSTGGFRSVAATIDGSGRLWVLTTSTDGEMRSRRTLQPPSASTSGGGWEAPSAPLSAGYDWGDVTVTTDDVGQVWMFATATTTVDGVTGRLFYRRQNADGSWTSMDQVGNGDWRGVSSTLKDGQVWLFGVKGSDSGAYSNRIFYFKSTASGVMGAVSTEFGAGNRWADVSASTDLSGRVWVFAPTLTDGLLRYRYTTPSGWGVSGSEPWGELGNGGWVSVSSSVRADTGKVRVLAAKVNGDLWAFETKQGSTATLPAGGGWAMTLVEPGGGGRGSYGL
ncbi:peptidoglycan DD-metalloendopeptidase family protein [Nocardioides stalactiti]|uniref:peptidoglycan DD-metalloendopeptidase family protein n=1 Tax=Nocardioides stalactiti TaxID=2755356 RepID=UPI0016047CB2|nr:peptidoglycan DD-metalloendopeptidase family protein [Nocardioides stalactiti]